MIQRVSHVEVEIGLPAMPASHVKKYAKYLFSVVGLADVMGHF